MSLDIGQVLGGRYAIERLIGHGLLGAVYQGRDQSTNQRVAVRLIAPEFDNDQLAAFVENEARAVGQLTQVNIARLVNIGFLPTGERCILTEYIEGETLKSRVKRLGRMPETQVAQVLIQVLEALSVAYKAGVLHRDLTPNSVLLSGSGDTVERATLIDFGISRLQVVNANPGAGKATGLDATSLQYLSPEQLNGLREIDVRSNVYSVGAIAYDAITGRRPFEGSDFSDPTMAVLQNEPKPVEELAPESSSPFVQLIRKAMARSPNARFLTIDEMLRAVRDWSTRAEAPRSQAAPGVGTTSVAPAAARDTPGGSSIAAPPPMPEQAPAPAPSQPSASVGAQARMAPPVVPEQAPAPAPSQPSASVGAQARMAPPVVPEQAPAPAPSQPSASVGAQARMAPPVVPADGRSPASESPASSPASARGRLTPPPPPPVDDPTAADIDQSVVDALFAPPPTGPHDDFAAPAEDWGRPPSAAPEPKSAPVSELQPPRLDPSRPGWPSVGNGRSAAAAEPAERESLAPPGAQAPVKTAPAAAPAETETAPATAPSPAAGAPAAAPVAEGIHAAQGARATDSAEATAAADSAAAEEPRPAAPPAEAPSSASALEAREPDAQAPLGRAVVSAVSAEGGTGSAGSDQALDETEKEKRTILGIAPAPATQLAPPVQLVHSGHRPPQPTAPGIHPGADAPAPSTPSASVPQRQPSADSMTTAPVGAMPAVLDTGTEAQPTNASAGTPSPSTAPEVKSASAGTPSPSTAPEVKITPAATPASVARQPAPAAAVSATVPLDSDDLGPYSRDRVRSRKRLAIAIGLVGLVGAGAAFALLQGRTDDASSGKSATNDGNAPLQRSLPGVSETKPIPSSDSLEPTVEKQPAGESTKSGVPSSQSTNTGSLSQSVAAAHGKKSVSAPSVRTTVAEKPAIEKPAVARTTAPAKSPSVSKPVAKPSAASAAPTKPAAPKGASKDPYNYR